MKRFHIYANSIKDPDGVYSARLRDMLIGLGADRVTMEGSVPGDTEAVVVLGGDGTILKAAGDTFGSGIPLLGVNLGNLGYLTESELETAEQDMKRLIEGDYSIEDRMLLKGIVRTGTTAHTDHCLNDVALSGYGALCIIRYDIVVNGEFLNNYSADGLIVSTPTGSTGYNLSAGGPIAKPGANIIILTPICPHTLNTRSIILSPDDEIRVIISRQCLAPVAVQFDGREPVMLEAGDEVAITGSEETTRLIRLRQQSFLSTLHEKLKPSPVA